jgi:hypothetical protein
MKITLQFDNAEAAGLAEAVREGDVTTLEIPLRDGRTLRLVASLAGGAVDAYWVDMPDDSRSREIQRRAAGMLGWHDA